MFSDFPPEFFAGLPSSGGTVPDPPQSVETIYGFLQRPSMFVNAVVSYGKVSNSVSSFTET